MRSNGFTLIELMIVIAILAIVAAVAAVGSAETTRTFDILVAIPTDRTEQTPTTLHLNPSKMIHGS